MLELIPRDDSSTLWDLDEMAALSKDFEREQRMMKGFRAGLDMDTDSSDDDAAGVGLSGPKLKKQKKGK